MTDLFSARCNKFIFLLLLLFFSCRKSNGERGDLIVPPMEYQEGISQVITPGNGFKFDADLDGKPDLLFSTRLVGDPIRSVDKMQFFVLSYPTASLSVDSLENVPKLHAGDSIPFLNFRGYTWYPASSVLLVEKIVGNEPEHWEGGWRDAWHAFLPFQCKRANLEYTGWVELTVDTISAQLIVHRAALCGQPERTSYCGK